jgi:hypothetical protein
MFGATRNLGCGIAVGHSTLYPNPLLVGSASAINLSQATAGFHSLLTRNRAFSNGLALDAHCTRSKNIDNTDNMADKPGLTAGGNVGNHDLFNFRSNRHLGLSDTPHRSVATVSYQLPFGLSRKFDSTSRVFRAIATNVNTNAADGLKPGMAGSDTFGAIGTATFNPRQTMLRAIIRFWSHAAGVRMEGK